MTPAAGALITPNVRLVRLLGKGGMGSVWVAEHLTLRTQVAVKFISDEHTQDAEALERFSREATAAAQIKSPHVVQVFDHGVYAGAPYIVMELLEGEDLAARIERSGPLPLGEAAAVLQQMGKALAQAHAQGIVHRDIKPANAFLTYPGGELLVKVLDFGVAKITRPGQDPSYRMTQTGQLVGTPCYMSPEQVFSRGDIDYRVDLWALAVLAYEAVTGELPFMGNTLGDIYLSINSAAFTLPTRVDRVYPRALDGWFERAFTKDPKGRFGSAKEMADAFASIAAKAPNTRRILPARAGQPPDAPPAGAVSVDMPTLRLEQGRGGRHRLGIAIGVIASAAAVGVIGTVLLFRAPPREPAASPPPAVATADPSAAPTASAGAVTTSAATTSAAPASSSSALEVEPAPEPTATASAAPSARPTVRPQSGRPRPPPPAPSAKKKHDHGF